MAESKLSRRNLLKGGAAALAVLPLLGGGRAFAAVNAALRASMKYQDKPNDGKDCAGCGQFVRIPGKLLGGCKIFPGDEEVSPKGWCVAWVAPPK